MQDSGIDIGDITARKALRKQLRCKTFQWYLVSVYPEMRMYADIIAYGLVRSHSLRVSFSHKDQGHRDAESQNEKEAIAFPCGACAGPADETQPLLS